MAGLELANWIRRRLGHGVTHLKLQKLVFYAYGAAAAHDVDAPLGAIRFDAWKHGPVCREVWRQFRDYGGAVIEPPAPWDIPPHPHYPQGTDITLRAALSVYDLLDAWSLRQESHLEAPWRDAFLGGRSEISQQEITTHFRSKFAQDNVRLPVLLQSRLSYAPDNIPVIAYRSLHDLANLIDAAKKANPREPSP